LRFIRTSLILLALSVNPQAHARSQYLDFWKDRYTDSRASEAGCQLCHQRSSGGNGWNFYGWTLRQELNGSSSVNQNTFRQVARFIEQDFANDPAVDAPDSIEFIDEIDNGAQPGWREGARNIIRFRGGNSQPASEPPDDLCGLVDQGSNRIPCPIFDPRPSAIEKGDIEIELSLVADELTAPLLALQQPGDRQNLFIVQQGGQVIRLNENGQRSVFFDASAQLVSNYGQAIEGLEYDERGLLGFAFHPNFVDNGRLRRNTHHRATAI